MRSFLVKYLALTLVILITGRTATAQELPRILSEEDAGLYQRIFDLQEQTNWRQADKLIKKLDSQLLMGHVRYQRYMHPTAYRSNYPELHLWMKAYADHPDAEKLYRLAVSRHRSDWKATPRPKSGRYLGGTGPGQPFFYSRSYKSKRQRSGQIANEVAHAKRVVRRYLFRGQPTNASEYLDKKKIRKLLDKVEEAQLEEKIALSFFLYGKDKEAMEYADAALKKSPYYAPHANWTAGLASWRLGNFTKASKYFAALSKTKRISGWTASRSAWWASRSLFRIGKAEEAVQYLKKAAAHPRTFYGLLALRQLGVQKPFDWALPDLSDEDLKMLLKLPSARRAIALSEAGQFHLAERELRSAFPSVKANLAPMLVSLSHKLGAPSVAMRMGLYLWEYKDTAWDAALYPLPAWKPGNGFKVDKALIFAFMRQESGFYSRAKSPVGAKGLMQLMPSTAAYLSGDKSLRNRKNRKLFNPEYNLQLGQKYLQYLMKLNDVGPNLFYLTIAYNGGPGNLIKWKKRAKGSSDPLFFIEAMQSRETRSFIKRVLTNFWVYRHRLGQDLPALDEIVEGRWPTYHALDNKSRKVADHARN